MSAALSSRPRRAALDLARGVAVLAMVAYHFVWDLWAFNLTDADLLGDPFWLGARSAIISTFLFIAGVCAMGPGDLPGLKRRFVRIAAGAAAVSAATYAAFPDSWIFFGVLHHLALGGLLAAGLRRLLPPAGLAALGLAVLWGGLSLGFDPLNAPWLRWIGMGSVEPASNDYVPLFPWFGVILLGMAAGPWLLRAAAALPAPQGVVLPRLAWLGRWSLLIYLLHQPVLYGGVWGWTQLAESWPGGTRMERDFMAGCRQTCIANGGEEAPCLRSCQCARDGLQAHDLWTPLLQAAMSPEQDAQARALILTCAGQPNTN